jgi:hypothetical protein
VGVTLLREVPAGAEIEVGRLPVTGQQTPAGCVLNNGSGVLRDLWVRVAAPGPVAGVRLNGQAAAEAEIQEGAVLFRGDLQPGENVVQFD